MRQASHSDDVVAASESTRRALEDLADRLDEMASGAAGGCLGSSEARVAAAAARQLRAIPDALAAGMREAFAVGREYGHREVALAEIALENRALSTLLARQAWGGGNPGNA